jgi:hypothetical protein
MLAMSRDPIADAERAASEARQEGLRECREYLFKVLPADIAEALSKDAANFLEYRQDDVGSARYYDGRRTNDTWVVQNKEIDMIAKLTPIGGAIASLAGAASLGVALLSFAGGLLLTFRQKKIELGPRDFTLLMFLKDRGPLSQSSLLEGLNSIQASSSFTWNRDGLAKDLDRLQKVATKEGVVIALVALAGDDRWSTNGI